MVTFKAYLGCKSYEKKWDCHNCMCTLETCFKAHYSFFKYNAKGRIVALTEKDFLAAFAAPPPQLLGSFKTPNSFEEVKSLAFKGQTDFKTLMKYAKKCVNVERIIITQGCTYDFDYIVANLANFPKLKELRFHDVRLNTFPLGLLNYKQLEVINLSQNYLQTLPCEIGYMPNLRELTVSYNPALVLPNCLKAKRKDILMFYDSMDTDETILPDFVRTVEKYRYLYNDE